MDKYKKWFYICFSYGLIGYLFMLPVKYYFLRNIFKVLYASSDLEHAKLIRQLHGYAIFGVDLAGILFFSVVGICLELIKMSTKNK